MRSLSTSGLVPDTSILMSPTFQSCLPSALADGDCNPQYWMNGTFARAFVCFPNQNRMQLDPAENLESDTEAFVGWAFAFDASLSD